MQGNPVPSPCVTATTLPPPCSGPESAHTAPPAALKSRGKKSAPSLALTPEAAEIAFLKQELNNAQTRITMLDSEVDDLNKTIKIQKARLKIFEEQQNVDSARDYFPDKAARSFPSGCLTASKPFQHTSCCHHPVCCCNHGHQSSSLRMSEEVLVSLSNTVKSLSNDLVEIKSAIRQQQSSAPSVRLPTLPRSPASNEPRKAGAEKVVVHVPACNDILVEAEIHADPSNMSISSIEEFVPPDLESDLNSIVPTSQQMMLMQ